MDSLKFRKPLGGTVICITDEVIDRGAAVADCIIHAPAEHDITVNGIECIERNGAYFATVPLDKKAGKVELVATDNTSGESDRVEVYAAYTPKKIFRVSVDDNIFAFQDIARHADEYDSIFDNEYFAMYRRLHEDYGAKFHFNLFYTTPRNGGFDLSQFPDKYKEEWLSVRDWLTLSFHAHADSPANPYIHSSYDEVYRDCKQVMDEIERFAGYRGYVTTLHYCEATKEGIRALYDCGVRVLLGCFELRPDGKHVICYSVTREQFDTVKESSFWKNPETDMILFATDVVLNNHPCHEIIQKLERGAEDYPDRNFVDMLIHEQLYYKDLPGFVHIPEYEDRIRAGIEWCLAHGYVPGLVRELITEELI
ncbi:MAG: hypothetical protein E7589_08195 [Ruminococcaceae bacterium]|nr:hypothetical protein [Oscillospiraceae bacterium]